MTGTPSSDHERFPDQKRSPDQPAPGSESHPQEQLSLDQLDEYIVGADTLQKELRARLDAIPRD